MTDPVGRKRGRYAVRPGGPHEAPSVTMVLGTLNKPGLPWGAANETALFAIHHRDEWEDLAADEAFDRLRKHHRGVWNVKASRGTAVHNLAQQWAQGLEVDCPPECAPYLDALERFYDDWQPAWVETERTVVHDVMGESYGGTFDAIADLVDGSRVLIDLKTGQRYPVETTLQLAAYRFASGMGVYEASGELVDVQDMVEVERASVLYLHDDATYELVPVPADRQAFGVFLDVRRAWGWLHEMERRELPGLTAAPARELEAAR